MILINFLISSISFKNQILGIVYSLLAAFFQLISVASIIPLIDQDKQIEIKKFLNIEFQTISVLMAFIVILSMSLVIRFFTQKKLLELSHLIGRNIIYKLLEKDLSFEEKAKVLNLGKLQNSYGTLNRRLVSAIIFPYFQLLSSLIQILMIVIFLLNFSVQIFVILALIFLGTYAVSIGLTRPGLIKVGYNFIQNNKKILQKISDIHDTQSILAQGYPSNKLLERYKDYDQAVRIDLIWMNLLASIPKFSLELCLGIILSLTVVMSTRANDAFDVAIIAPFAFGALKILPLSQLAAGSVSALIASSPIYNELLKAVEGDEIDHPHLSLIGHADTDTIKNLKVTLSDEQSKPRVFLISGDSGVGKSRLLNTFVEMDEGVTFQLVDSRTHVQTLASAPKKRKILYLNSEHCLIVGSLLDNLTLFTPNINEESLAQLGLDHYSLDETTINKLSSGEKQKVSVLRFSQIENHIIILDETIAGVDIISKNKILEILNQNNNSIFIVNHGLHKDELELNAEEIIITRKING